MVFLGIEILVVLYNLSSKFGNQKVAYDFSSLFDRYVLRSYGKKCPILKGYVDTLVGVPGILLLYIEGDLPGSVQS